MLIALCCLKYIHACVYYANILNLTPYFSDLYIYTYMQVQAVTSTTDLQSLLELEFDFRFDCGYTKPTMQITMDDRHDLVKAIWLHYVYFLPLAELQQLRKGFRETLQMELLTVRHSRSVHSLLIASQQFEVTADFFMDSFSIMYSPQGSNNRTKEEAIILYWNEYVTECVGEPVSVSDLLSFMSGASKLPAAGFDKTPSIHFMDDNGFPRASTCDLSISFPRDYGLLSCEDFKTKMDMAITNSFGFGRP